MRIFVTGSSGCLAQALLPVLCARPGVSQVTGIDLRTPVFRHARFAAHRLDIRDSALGSLMRNHDTLIHLAFVVLRGHMRADDMADINVRGSLAVFYRARAAGIKRLIHLSSAAVYGTGLNMTELAPFAPLPGFLYAEHKAELERRLAAEFPDCVRLRPHSIVGPHAQPTLKWLIRQPCYVKLPEPEPLLQCVHEDDIVRAVLACLDKPAHGAYNLAAADSFSLRDMVQRRHRWCVALPFGFARAALHAVWRITGFGGEPAWVDGLDRTLTVDCTRAASELGWKPAYRSVEALAAIDRIS